MSEWEYLQRLLANEKALEQQPIETETKEHDMNTETNLINSIQRAITDKLESRIEDAVREALMGLNLEPLIERAFEAMEEEMETLETEAIRAALDQL